MQKMDRATLLELSWRDFMLWPLVRPAGLIYEFLASLLAMRGGRAKENCSVVGFLQREIFTAANLVTMYGIFLIGEATRLMWALIWNQSTPYVYSISFWLIGFGKPLVTALSWLTLEIFLTDIIDGPLARVNQRITALGTFLDHFRDYKIGFIATSFLIILAVKEKKWELLTIESFLAVAFLGISVYHLKFLFLKWRAYEFRHRFGEKLWFGEFVEFLRDFALNEYQTDLLGRIQFGTMAFGLCSGLFYHATGLFSIYATFLISIVAGLFMTSVYFYRLWGMYCERWEKIIQVKSDRIKTRMIDRTSGPVE